MREDTTSRCVGRVRLVRVLVALALMVSTGAAALADVDGSAASGAADELGKVERRIRREPAYVDAPRYALLVFGAKAETKVWMVEDGKTLYVDRNANGDLTDDGGPLKPTELREIGRSSDGSPRWDFAYVLDAITPQAGGSRHTKFRLSRWNYGQEEDGYGLSVHVDGVTPMYAGWTPFWADSAGEAQVIHFGGRLRPRLLRLEDGALTYNSNRLSVAFITPGVGKGAYARLSIEAPLPMVAPVVRIDWPVAKGAEPLRTTHRLTQRCCYWEFYDPTFKVPDAAVAGKAAVTVLVPPGALPYEVVMERMEVGVRN